MKTLLPHSILTSTMPTRKDPKYYPWNFQRCLDFKVSNERSLIFAELKLLLTGQQQSQPFLYPTSILGGRRHPWSPSKKVVVGLRISIDMVIWRPSVCVLIGSVNCPSSFPCKIVSENGKSLSRDYSLLLSSARFARKGR